MKRRAFTILEVMLAIGLLVLLTGGLYAFLWNLMSQREAVATEAARDQAAGVLFERLEADLTGAVAGDAKQAGLVGTASEITIRGRGVAMPLQAEDRDSAMNDMQGTQFSFDAGALRGRRWVGDGEAAGEYETISGDVQRVRFRYSDGRTWHSSFDSGQTGTLPVAVEVAVWFGREEAHENTEAQGHEGQKERETVGAAEPRAADSTGIEPDGSPDEATDGAHTKVPTREPDRRRLIIVPDGPVAAWKGGQS